VSKYDLFVLDVVKEEKHKKRKEKKRKEKCNK